jgi:hypothetical protein
MEGTAVMNIDPRKRYRIEFRNYNIGAGNLPVWAPRSGSAATPQQLRKIHIDAPRSVCI